MIASNSTGLVSPHGEIIPKFDCGTDASSGSDHFLNTVTNLHIAHFLHANASGLAANSSEAPHLLARRASGIPTIDVYMHIVTTKASSGMAKQSQLQPQVDAMNKAYNPHGVSFALKGSDVTVNDKWAVGASTDDDLAMKKSLRKGPYRALNLYFQSDMSGGVLGKCTLPTNVGGASADKSVYAVDGCNIAAGTLPTGPMAGYNMGMTAVHETGHWLGLLHTFEGYSCSGNGDFVADTPEEAQSTDGCPTSPAKNTCGSVRSGDDPIHNFMDYSTDACYEQFSLGQETRMKNMWSTYRSGN